MHARTHKLALRRETRDGHHWVFDILISALLWRECFAAFVIACLMIIIRMTERKKERMKNKYLIIGRTHARIMLIYSTNIHQIRTWSFLYIGWWFGHRLKSLTYDWHAAVSSVFVSGQFLKHCIKRLCFLSLETVCVDVAQTWYMEIEMLHWLLLLFCGKTFITTNDFTNELYKFMLRRNFNIWNG